FIRLTAVSLLQKINPFFPNGRIIGGENAVIESFPYQISLEYLGYHTCGGSIISAHYVVTAGHCVDVRAAYLTIRAGSSLKGQGGSVHQVDKIIRHEQYFTNDYGVPHYDVSLLHVKQPFQFDDSRQPINLFDVAEESEPGVKSIITGWGNTGKGSPIQLQTVSVPIVSKTICNNAYSKFGGIPEGQICAAYYGVGGKDACQGDSGGPLSIDGRLAGIVSWGNGCALAKYPGVYTEISHYREWINEHAELGQ
ncbi:PREDICTED: trypsin-1-like, partial [Ceratosolen solmsi marchali]|uniref:Trypsin-1-like n=1 Tax=Ceratosolen solmsi marchali TaxID=326594 RepID=A0AAJ6YQ42_9HYME